MSQINRGVGDSGRNIRIRSHVPYLAHLAPTVIVQKRVSRRIGIREVDFLERKGIAPQQPIQIADRASNEIIEANNFVAKFHEAPGQLAADKSGNSRNKNGQAFLLKDRSLNKDFYGQPRKQRTSPKAVPRMTNTPGAR